MHARPLWLLVLRCFDLLSGCRLMLAALVVLLMISLSNFGALFFCCSATYRYGLWLKTYHSKDLACLRILVGLALP